VAVSGFLPDKEPRFDAVFFHVLYIVDEDVVTAYSGDEYIDEAKGPSTASRNTERRRSRNSVVEHRRPTSTLRRRCATVAPLRPS